MSGEGVPTLDEQCAWLSFAASGYCESIDMTNPQAKAILGAIKQSLTHYTALRAALDVAALSAGVAALVIAAGDGDGGYDSARCREYAAKLRHLIQIQEGA